MKVILLADVKGTGKKNEVVEVSEGFARNFLFPRKAAKEATAAQLNSLRTAQAAQEHRAQVEREEAVALSQKYNGQKLSMQAKVGNGDRLFGSITAKEVAEALESQLKISVDRRKVELAEPIRALGTYKAVVRYYPEISFEITVEVTAK